MMRKCDICGTVIPVGSTHCPNCGFKYKTEQQPKKQYKSDRQSKTVPKVKFDIDLPIFKIITKILICLGIVLSAVSAIRELVTISQSHYYPQQYGDNYDTMVYGDFYDFNFDHPELAKEIVDYYDELINLKERYEKLPENTTTNGVQSSIRVVNNQLDSVDFSVYILDDFNDIGVFYSLHKVNEESWNVYVSAEAYNIKKDALTPNIKMHLDYLGEILGIDMNDIIDEILPISNYYNVRNYETEIDGYSFEFYHKGQGDYTIYLSKILGV